MFVLFLSIYFILVIFLDILKEIIVDTKHTCFFLSLFFEIC